MTSVNPWHKFRSLLPFGIRTVATITGDNGDGTVNADTQGGDSIRIKGTGSAGQRVLVVDGEVRQVLPSLPQDSVDV